MNDLLLSIQDVSKGRKIYNPSTGELVGLAPDHSVEELERCISTAVESQPSWDQIGHNKRSKALRAAADAIEAASEQLADILTREQGKPLNGPNARFEVGACASWLRTTADLSLEPETVLDSANGRGELHYRPIGVVGAIGPWNWPMLITIWQVSAALRMGNAVVVKPSEFTPLSVLALVETLNTVLPTGVLNVVSGGRSVGEALAAHPKIGKIMFTGSTVTGKAIIRSSADSVKRLTLELGGNDAGIVLPDADPKEIANDLFWGAFLNAGQTCAALKRLYVHEDIYDAVCDELTAIAITTPMGDGLDEGNLLGPVQNRQQYEIVSRLVESARASGARVLIGGDPNPHQPGNFYPVTLVADIENDNPLVSEEQFGPALPIIRYSSVEDAVTMANGLRVGLGASVWSADANRAREIAATLQAGSVWINAHGMVHPMVPFGGSKESGYGLEFGAEGLKSLGIPQAIHFK